MQYNLTAAPISTAIDAYLKAEVFCLSGHSLLCSAPQGSTDVF